MVPRSNRHPCRSSYARNRLPASLHRCLTTLALLLVVSVPGGGQGTPVPSAVEVRPALRAGSVTGALRIDGRLDEAAWSAADSIDGITEIEPREGVRPSGRTVIRVLASADAIIIGIRADDPEPGGIVTFARERDAALANEDHVKIVLDTYQDGRSGYIFAMNPNGARYDALVANRGEGEDANWDAIWEGRTARTPTGWSAEIRIPAQILLFRTGLADWGFNVQRRVQRLQETSRWASPRRDIKIAQPSRTGLITGVPPFELGRGLSIRPSATVGGGVPAPNASFDGTSDVSLDVTQRLGANTLGSLTVNTDFAETEVDTRRTNLTRFPLFFPEKRTFFLEGADVFEFGLGINEDVRAFFSRRIGLLGGQEVPLDGGVKVNGRLSGTSFGALTVRTGELDTLPTDNTIGAVRIQQNVLGESSLGVLATFGDPLGRAGARTLGADFTYQTSHFRGNQNFLVGIWGLRADRDGLTGNRSASGIKIDYPNDLWDIAFTYKTLGDSLQPSLGFVPRPGVRITALNINFMPRPTRPIGPLRVRTMLHELQNRVVTDLNGKWESYRVFTAPFNWRLENGDRYEFNVVPTGERLVAPFEIADGVIIPAGSYHWNRYRVEGQFAAKRKLSGQLTWWFGDFYGGTLDQFILTSAWKPSPVFILEMNGERNLGNLPEGNFTQTLVGTRARLNLTPDVQFSSFVQYDTDSRNLGANSRLRWTFNPMGELFVVYNHNIERQIPLDGSGGRGRRWELDSNALLVKVQYAVRM
jgi:uncharacterized protein DUF5916